MSPSDGLCQKQSEETVQWINKWRDCPESCEGPTAIIVSVGTSIGRQSLLGNKRKEVKDFVDYQLDSLKRDTV